MLLVAGSASALLYALACVLVESEAAGPRGLGPRIAAYPGLTAVLFIAYAGAVAAVLARGGGPSRLPVVLAFAVLFRLTLVFAPPALSDDIYRYVWDGRVQAAGINPYLHPPSAEALAGLRDDAIHPHINRPDARTIYPPGSQLLFLAIQAAVPDSARGFKLVMVLFDLAAVGLLLRLLGAIGLDRDRVIVYAWSPLVVFELAGSGHAEASMLPFVLAALLARTTGRPGLAGAALGAATLVKLYPALLLPALYGRGDRRLAAAFAAVIVLGYAPYVAGAGAAVVGYLPAYVGPAEDFNVGLRHVLTALLAPATSEPRLAAIVALGALVLAAALYLGRADGGPSDGRDLLRRVYLTVSAYFLLLPTSLHPWYLVWLVPWLCVHPSWGWLLLTAAVSLSYLEYGFEPASLYPGLWVAQFVPVYALLLVEIARHRRRGVPGAAPLTVEEP